MTFLFQVGFLPFRLLDVLDILIVGYLIYQIYKLLRGSIAFNIFVGVLLIFVVWWLVGILKMELLSLLLGQFVSIGVIMFLIIFQPEVRRFLLLLGDTTLKQRSSFFDKLIRKEEGERSKSPRIIQELKRAILRMARNKTGALIVIANNLNVEFFSNSGVTLDAFISQALIESIFNKESPLHDGAVVIVDGKIKTASCVLPVSANPNLPKSVGLRHRAGVGVTESTNVAVFIVSEENGKISFAHEGNLERNLTEAKLTELLTTYL
ncbi:MAG TPA: TIGR00159 family protein [Saprospiraceae bacterium]|nr:TIGR00159 family protein [Saprospiraceae bacterium]